MRNNLIFSGISKKSPDNHEPPINGFKIKQLKMPPNTNNNITFHCVYHLDKLSDKPQPITAKFKHFQKKELVKSRGRELKGTTFGPNDQYPHEINK